MALHIPLRRAPVIALMFCGSIIISVFPYVTEAATLVKPPNNLGLVGYWSFNEGVGTVATDFSGNGNNGTLTNSPTWGRGKFGSAVNFDGSTSHYVSLGTSVGLNPSLRTITAWVYPRSLGGQSAGIVIGDGSTFSLGLCHTSGDCSGPASTFTYYQDFDPTSGLWGAPANTVRLNQWQFIALSFDCSSDANNPVMYYNGQSVTVTELNPPEGTAFCGTTSLKTIGEIPTFNLTFNGLIDEVRIYNRILSAPEIAALYNSGAVRFTTSSVELQKGSTLANGLVGHWTFDGPDVSISGVTMTATDRSGSGNNATQNDNYPARIIGKLGQGLTFDGNDDYLELPDMGTVEAYPFTFAAWFKTNANDSSQSVLSQYQDDVAARRVQLYYNNDGDSFCWNVRSSAEAEPCTTLAQDGTWHHAVGVSSSATNHRLYVDGVLANSSATDVPAPSVNAANIGDWNGQPNFEWSGTIDDVRIYNRALTAGEVKQLYNLGQGIIRP